MKKTFMGWTLEHWILGLVVYSIGKYLGCFVYDDQNKTLGFAIIFFTGILFGWIGRKP